MSTVQMSSGFRKPLLMPVGVQSTRSAPMRYEWLPSLPAQKPFCQMRRPMSHICSLSFHSLMRLVPLEPLDDVLVAPYAMGSDLQLDDHVIENGRVVGVQGDAFFRVKGHDRLAAFGEG